MWNVLAFLQNSQSQLWSYEQFGFNSLINTLFWCTTATIFIFYWFSKFLKRFLRYEKISTSKWTPTIRIIWNISFYVTCITVLFLYKESFIAPRILRETNGLFPKYRNTLFLPADHCSAFNIITIILATFHITSAILDWKERDFISSVSMLLYTCVIISLDYYGLENYSVTLNISFAVFKVTDDLATVSSMFGCELHFFFYFATLCIRLFNWMMLFLFCLPYKFLIPTLYASKFKIWLNLFLWCWYGPSVWNSPILQYLYHVIYHKDSIDCSGNVYSPRCILFKNTPENRHQKMLQQAVRDIKTAEYRKNKTVPIKTENASAAALQTLKCMMTIKRKLRRIRENKEVERMAQSS